MLLVAVRTATVPAVLAALVSAAAYNFFFTAPRFTFYVSHTDDLSTVVFFLAVGLIAGQLAGRLRRQMQALRATGEQTQTQAELNRRLAAAPDLKTMAAAAADTLAERFRVPVLVLAPLETGSETLGTIAASQSELALDGKARHAAQWAFDHRQPSGQFTNTLASVSWRFVPLYVDDEAFGVIAVRFAAAPPPHGEILATLDVLVTSVALAMARTRMADHLEACPDRRGNGAPALRHAVLGVSRPAHAARFHDRLGQLPARSSG